MSDRRGRDGELNPDDGGAQAVGPRSVRKREGRRRPVGEPGVGDDAPAPRVHGAWTTPAVVVRRPDGSIVSGDAGKTSTADGSGTTRATDGAGAGAPRPAAGPVAGREPRVRPRRIPGAPGAVLLSPTLSASDGRDARRRRRSAVKPATVTPLPPRRVPASPAPDDESARPSLRPVRGARRGAADASPGAGDASARRVSAGRGSPGPSPARPGERRQQRVLQALSGLSLERLLPADDDARQRRSAQLRRIGSRLAVVALAGLLIYGVFPVRTWINQREALDRARERQEVFERENPLLEDEVSDLRTDARVEEEARELGFVLPGEESYGVLPAPEAPASSPSTTTTQPGD